MTTAIESLTFNVQIGAIELLDNQPDPVLFYLPVWSEVETDRKIIDFQVAYANQKAIADFHLAPEQLLSQQEWEPAPVHSSWRTLWFNQLLQAFQGNNKTDFQYVDPTSNKHFNLECTKVKEGLWVVVRDVTSQVQTGSDMGFWNATSHGLVVLKAIRNEAGKIVDFTIAKANDQFAKLIQQDEEWIGKSSAAIWPRNNGIFEQQCQVLANGETVTNELFYSHSNKWHLVTLSRYDDDNLVVTFTDITEKRSQKEEQLQQYGNRLQVVFETAHAGMYTLIPVRDAKKEIIDFRFGLVNQAVASYLGLQAEDLADSLGSTYFPAYKTNGLFDKYIETMTTGNPATFDLHYADGYDNFFTINVVKMGDELFGTFTDHSCLKRLQRELEASIAELKRSNASLEQFAHAASHDLQEPLRKITLYTSKLEDHHAEELTDKAYGHLERIKTCTKRMQRLIKDLLVFAEVGANRPDFETVALNTLLQEVLDDLEVAITERDAVITIGDLGTIKGDSLHLHQLFQNLISNSIKYSRPEAAPHITITATLVAGKDSDFDLGAYEAEKSYWQIQLQDNGQGFNNEQAHQIFKIFQRLPQHRNEYTGTGIGLAIVQRVVENHKGYIRAEGVPGAGATFTILLPASS